MRYTRTLILWLTLLLPAVLFSADRHALIIGLGCYRDQSWGKIHGDRDIPIIKDMLQRHHYTDISTLENSQATKKGITSAFAALADRCGKNDKVYIHFSGHGQRMTDVNGDEDDGWDETWIAYDARQSYSDDYHGENHLTDDEIGLWLTKIRQKIGTDGHILVVVDACHSGDSSRGDNDEYCVRGVINNFIIPLPRKPEPIKKIKEDWLTLSACKNFQLNCEITTDNGNFGMLSYALSHMRADLPLLNNIKLMKRLSMFIDDNRGPLPQTPTLSGETTTYSISSMF